MHLQQDESLIKTFYRHPFPYALRIIGIAIASLPFFFVASFFQGVFDSSQMLAVYATIAGLFVLFGAYFTLLFFLDRLVITNERVVHITWRNLLTRDENEAELDDTLEIQTQEFGILSSLRIFDYGTFHLETAASDFPIVFKYANDPEGIKHFIYHLQQKPSKIRALSDTHFSHDSTLDQKTSKESSEESKIGITADK